MELALTIGRITLSSLCILAVIASKIKLGNWWIRVFDFPRIQLLTLATIAIVLFFIPSLEVKTWNLILLSLVVFSFFFQAKKISSYTFFAKKEVRRFQGIDQENEIALLVSNVLTPNRQVQKLIDLVHQYQPNLVLTLESDKWWENHLKPLEKDFPYQVKIPLDNLYGMHLYSNLPLENTKVHYLVKDDIPSIHSEVVLPSGKKVQIHCVHPEPPSPTESDTSVPRDAELLIVGKNVKNADLPVLVFGDLNDVAWSRTTRLFQKISGLLDPRKGRGFYNTFHARHVMLRWPLDHIFHSDQFQLKKIKRLPSISSDHFPMFIHLVLSPENRQEDQEEKLDQDEKRWTKKTIDDANPNILTI
ncbi:MAG: endonuclease/exonuclease/phosphatase family protein [Cyclobacterium sp.]|uniref:endonuclease/exonuclease/phosphatase family protein n=1 Tax=unclassified Cyclobacterium TaxID=2615055 RepID=UPI0013D6EE31|nr:endonuclease/exonuclease/phosphatase family protein [Cyclobacterium sp. SYSU L10401]